MPDRRERSPWLPPRWFIHLFWRGHRALYRLTRGRTGLWPPKPGSWGTLRLTTVGRRTGRRRSVILGYVADGPNLVTLAMNGWGAPEPAWWLNLRAHPEAEAEVPDGQGRVRHRRVRAHAATGEERARLWDRWREVQGDLDAHALRRPGGTAVVVLAPATAPPD
ncbi:nitroreductase/quinone reductase family protein [Nocardiopsis sp. RSe5-2]|uniref:Nitroreductase/quinone reductase family protein n=1 Tax=Nocardiopsis endophytica TaxID=3018445 RepID=A0ABT4UBB4_9ACTN|nr:nitroreductase/quinone reductase family protein [Nocardiopsis endophytica]MDA2814215.1 nitroreductase/quinone reductase family protein [Nocardiopsis endophytica]